MIKKCVDCFCIPKSIVNALILFYVVTYVKYHIRVLAIHIDGLVWIGPKPHLKIKYNGLADIICIPLNIFLYKRGIVIVKFDILIYNVLRTCVFRHMKHSSG